MEASTCTHDDAAHIHTDSEIDIANSDDDPIMIALYYWYVTIPEKILKSHSQFQQTVCEELQLNGRIRLSEEGINGVLSGTKSNLEIYEKKLRDEVVVSAASPYCMASVDSNNSDLGPKEIQRIIERERVNRKYGEFLDVKYCHLRDDLPVDKQKFTSLSVKITREVVSLNEIGNGGYQQRSKRSRRRKAKARKQDQERSKGKGGALKPVAVTSTSTINGTCSGSSERQSPGALQKDNDDDDKRVNNDSETNSATHLTSPVVHEQLTQQAPQLLNLDNYEPAQHLTPQEWNEKLLQNSQKAHTSLHPDHDEDRSNGDGDGHGAILIDARNVYESNIGHFRLKNVPTLLTNTRKYSTIPSVLKASIPNMAGRNVFMYCTGGVRCERASVYLKALSESSEWPEGVEKPKAIYQLQGGIQKYLETYGEKEGQDRTEEPNQDLDQNQDGRAVVENSISVLQQHQQDQESSKASHGPCLFAGKNFVFDQRRYDPVIGRPSNGECHGVGKCVLCLCDHDDYDNGYAPCDNKEARCCRCRVLVLVCNDCRSKVRIWGEEHSEGGSGGSTVSPKPDLFCGEHGECINEGNEVDHCEIRRCQE